MCNNKYEIGIIGAGVAGVIAALKASRNGKKVIIFEKSMVGGTVAKWGAIPMAEMIKCANLISQRKKFEAYGLEGAKDISLNWAKLKKQVQKKVKSFSDTLAVKLENSNVEIVHGTAEILDRNIIESVGGKYQVNEIIIATGASYELPPFIKDKRGIYTSKTIEELEVLPTEMVIIGGGLIGIEYALLFSDFGVKVTILEAENEIMDYLDCDLKGALVNLLKAKKILVRTNYYARAYTQGVLTIDNQGKKQKVQSECFLLAINRAPDFSGLNGLIALGLRKRAGYIETDLNLRTSLPGIYAIGDINGRALLAHVAAKEADIVVETILGNDYEIMYDFIHYNMYATSQLASIGMTEEIALKSGFLVSSMKYYFDNIEEHFVKVVLEKENREVLGVHIYGRHASELICEAAKMIEGEYDVSDFSKLVHIHPIDSAELVDNILVG